MPLGTDRVGRIEGIPTGSLSLDMALGGQGIPRGRVAEVQRSADRLSDAIKAHFSLEDDVFFPAFHGLYPETARELNALMREHVDCLDEFVRLRTDLAPDTLAAFAKEYRAFSRSIAEHESREERLIASLPDVSDAIR